MIIDSWYFDILNACFTVFHWDQYFDQNLRAYQPSDPTILSHIKKDDEIN